MTFLPINQPKSRIKLLLISSSFAILLIPANAKQSQAITLVDWDTIGWQNGVLNQDFHLDSHVVKIDLTLGSEAKFVSFDNASTPSVNGILNGTNSDSGENINQSLHLQLDASQVGGLAADPTPYTATMNVQFHKEQNSLFSDVSFMLYDIDIGMNWQDRVSVIGIGENGQIAPKFTILNPEYVKQVNAYTIDGIKAADNDRDFSNVLVSFSSPINSFQLMFTDGDSIGNINPGSHGIGIGDISAKSSATSVPEPTSTVGLLALGVMGISSQLKKVKQRS
jgi:hypothetical protein